MFATLNGVRLFYTDRGKGKSPALLLIHGFPLDHRLWDAQLAALARTMRVIAPDLRGHGASAAPAGPFTMDQHADDLAALLDHLKVRQAVVAGLSMGGYVAFAFWRRHKERVQALALLDTRAEPDSVVAKANRDVAAARVQEVGAAAYSREMLPRLLAPASQADEQISGAALMMEAQSVAGFVGDLRSLRDRADSRPILPTITVPTLVLVGEADALTPPTDAQTMVAAIPDARLAVIPQAGHLSPLENPKAVNAALREFVRVVTA
ncbi:MAG: alpha/beta fold hydrolase [Chloroflexi bacterium]|nr:alpha/beta fold hydrolase [Chloroflexota bacterium]